MNIMKIRYKPLITIISALIIPMGDTKKLRVDDRILVFVVENFVVIIIFLIRIDYSKFIYLFKINNKQLI